MLAKVLEILTIQYPFLWVKKLLTVRKEIKPYQSFASTSANSYSLSYDSQACVGSTIISKTNVENIKSVESNIIQYFRKSQVLGEKGVFNLTIRYPMCNLLNYLTISNSSVNLRALQQRSPNILAPGTRFMKDKFSMDRVGEGEGQFRR